MLKIVLADDESHVRSALRLVLEQELDVEVVGEAACASRLCPQLDRHLDDTAVYVVLLDWDLPGLHDHDVLRHVRQRWPTLRLVALSGRPEQRAQALRAGLDAFVCKGDAPETLLATLRSLDRG